MANGIFSNTQSIIEYLYCYKFHSSQKATNQIALYWIHLCAVPYALSQWVKTLPFCHGCVNECVLAEIAHIVVSIMASPPSHPLHNENQIINNGIFKIVSYLIGSIPKDSIDCKITIYILDTPTMESRKINWMWTAFQISRWYCYCSALIPITCIIFLIANSWHTRFF